MKNKGRSKWLREGELAFLAKFLILFFALYSILKIVDITALNLFIASFEFELLKLFNVSAILEGVMIHFPNTTVEFVDECSGLLMPILLASLLWSTNIENNKRIKYLILFTPFLFIFNLLRLLVTVLPLALIPGIFNILHVLLWFVDSAVVLMIWMHAQGIKLSDLM